jgi:hypothetical protein
MSGDWYRASRYSWRLRRISAAMKNDVLNQSLPGFWEGPASLDAPLGYDTTDTRHLIRCKFSAGGGFEGLAEKTTTARALTRIFFSCRDN